MDKPTLIFPMAGRGSRFGHNFKPFLEVEGQGKFIELAFEPFRKWISDIERVLFIYLKQQEKEYGVSSKLKQLFSNIEFDIFLLEEETNGPAETIRLGIEGKNINGPVILCDCDHAFNVDSLFKLIPDEPDCILPVWPLKNENIRSWSVVSIEENSVVTGIAENHLPDSHGEFFGVIGCYYLKSPVYLDDPRYKNVSDAVLSLIKSNRKISAAKVTWAKFFGDPERLKKTLAQYKNQKGTIFCDLDGTIFVHESPVLTKGIKMLDGAAGKIREWREQGYCLVFTTARDPSGKDYLVSELEKNNIKYDELIMGLPSGPRFLINDRKPSDLLKPSASAFEVKRNEGIKNLMISLPDINIIKRMNGGSFADTLLIERCGKQYIRKTVSKKTNLELGYLKLKNQASELSRFNNFCDDLVPTVVSEEDNSFEYYYEMEYLENYKALSEYSPSVRLEVSESLLQILKNKIYVYRASLNNGEVWLQDHLHNKIYKNVDLIDDCGEFKNILECTLSKYSKVLSPKSLCPIHGDLTFENILYRPPVLPHSADIKLIDMDGAEYMDAIELDMGKMFQSIITNYETWSRLSDSALQRFCFSNESDNIDKAVSLWSKILNEDISVTKAKAYFYTALHLIRMISFRLRVSDSQAQFAYKSAIELLSQINEKYTNL
ncbi:hypothetical protein OAJ78_06450 [Gammaproteobacteria bacterium]|nr:hypothetical protein [Gammaproteobacteria bacterium]